MDELLAELRSLIGADGILTAPADLDGYTLDWRRRFRGPTLAVALPRTTSQVSDVVRACARHAVAIIPQGGNTGMSGGSVPLASQGPNVIVGLGRMNRIRAVDRDNNTMTVDAGCVLQTIQQQAEAVGRYFPLSLGAEGSCQIGGNLSTNAGGTAVLRYGNARDLVLGLEVVLADGTIWDGLRLLRKDNTGYDLKALFMGAEGTLGLITGAVLKLFAPLRERASAWIAVSSLERAVGLLSLSRDTLDARIAAFEYVSQAQLRLVLEHVPGTIDPLPTRSAGYVLLELADSVATGSLAALLEDLLARAMQQGLADDAVIASSERQAQSFWKIRHSVSEANRAHGMSLNHDVSVPTSRLAEFVGRATDAVNASFPQAEVITVTHLGDGNVHFLAIFPRSFWSGLTDAEDYVSAVRRTVYDIAMDCGGSFSAEHGVGQSLTAELVRYRSATELALFRRVKAALDPDGIMNPGKVLGTPGV